LVANMQHWKAKWPNHCRACNGWGVLSLDQTSNTLIFCEQLAAPGAMVFGQCHRCGSTNAEATREIGEHACAACNWQFDDGLGNGTCNATPPQLPDMTHVNR